MKARQKIAFVSLATGIAAGIAVKYFFDFVAWWFVLLVILVVSGSIFGEALKLSADQSIVDSKSINRE